jgi:hypothetical protein
MATEKEENLLCLIEVMKNEMFLIGQTCFNAKWIMRYELSKVAREADVEFDDMMETDFIREHDRALDGAVERILKVIGLAEERVRELSVPRVCDGE